MVVSLIGGLALPNTAPLDAKIKFFTLFTLQASKKLNVPLMFILKAFLGFLIFKSTPDSAAR